MALGTILALLSLKGKKRRPVLGLAHGLAGLAGLALFLLAERDTYHEDGRQAGFFAGLAAISLLLALLCGPLVPFLGRRFPGVGGVALALHACAAITGFVVFLAWTSMR